MLNRILITGASGMVGYAVCREALELGFDVTGLGRTDRHSITGMKFIGVELTDAKAVCDIMHKIRPTLVVHLAANTNHALCEKDPEAARQLHVISTEHLASLSYHMNSHFIHVSSEAVYGNKGYGLRSETEVCHPQGVYAVTKLEAEAKVASAHSSALILRVTPVGFVSKKMGNTLAEWLFSQFVNQLPVMGYQDVFFTPISSNSLAKLLLDPKVLQLNGVYNWGISETISKYDFALELSASLGFKDSIIHAGKRFATDNVHHAAMDSSRLASALAIPLPSKTTLFQDLFRNAPFNCKNQH